MSVFKTEEVKSKLNDLSGWSQSDDSIVKEYETKDFVGAAGLVAKIAILAEKMDHHPDILLHSWNKVKITLSSHDEGGITEKDIKLAKQIEALD